MRILNAISVLSLWAAGQFWALGAAVPPAEQLLPNDTLAVLTVPDWSKLEAARKESPLALLWQDESLRPFRDKLLTKVTNDVIAPIEQELGFKLADYAELLQGQFTVAITQNGWNGSAQPLPGFLLALDTRDKAELLKKNLAEVKKRLTDAGRNLRNDKIREVEFTTVILDLGELQRNFSKAADESAEGAAKEKSDATPEKPEAAAKPGTQLELSLGQVDSVLLVGTSAKDLEKVLARLAGGGTGVLAELPAFEADARQVLRDALASGWIHFAPLADIVAKLAASAGDADVNQASLVPAVDKIIGALGVNSLKTLAFNVRAAADGEFVDLFLGAPEEKRKGLFNLLATQTKDASPPGFVPADAVQFTRWRADGQKLWAAIEAIANDIAPGMLGFLTAELDGAMKEKDPAFSFKKNLVGNLGDDVISYQKAPRGTALEDLSTPPTLSLLASPNPEQLLQGLRSVFLMLPAPFSSAEFKEREFLGRKIYSLPLPGMPAGAEKPTERSLQLAASGGYLALTTDAAILEEYLRSGENKPKALAEKPGLAEAAQKIGGMGTGLFGYQNDAENIRITLEVLRNNAEIFSQALALSPLAPKTSDADKALKEWLDFSLLPPFEKIAKYFSLTVYAGNVAKEGYTLKTFTPKPPQAKP